MNKKQNYRLINVISVPSEMVESIIKGGINSKKITIVEKEPKWY